MNKFPIINYNYAVVNNHEILEFKYSDPNSSFVIKDLKTGLKKCKFEFEAPQYNNAGEYTLTYREFSPEQQTKPISGFSEIYKEDVEQEEIIAHRKKAAEILKTFPPDSPDMHNILNHLPSCIKQYL